MNGRNLTRRASLMGLAALVLGGCDRLNPAPPARIATVRVDASAKTAFVAAIERFAAVRRFALKRSGAQATLTLGRADMEITLSTKAATAASPLTWQVTCDKSQGTSGATLAEIDEMADELLANVLAVKGVELISSDKPVCGVTGASSSGLHLTRNCDQK